MALTADDLALLSELLREELDRALRRELSSPTSSEVVMISQANCEVSVGLSPRQFLDLLRRDDAPPSAKVGKMRLVRREALVSFLDRLAAKTREVEREPEPEPDGVEEVLREIGAASVGRARRGR